MELLQLPSYENVTVHFFIFHVFNRGPHRENQMYETDSVLFLIMCKIVTVVKRQLKSNAVANFVAMCINTPIQT